ncbi:hypothetical protein ACWCXE_31785 [Streptomyces sp. NPDC001780]
MALVLPLHTLSVAVFGPLVAVEGEQLVPHAVGGPAPVHPGGQEVRGPFGGRPVVDIALGRGIAVAMPPARALVRAQAVIDPGVRMRLVEPVPEQERQAPLAEPEMHLHSDNLQSEVVGVQVELHVPDRLAVQHGDDLAAGQRCAGLPFQPAR